MDDDAILAAVFRRILFENGDQPLLEDKFADGTGHLIVEAGTELTTAEVAALERAGVDFDTEGSPSWVRNYSYLT